MNKMKAIIKQFFLHGVGKRFTPKQEFNPFFSPFDLYRYLLIDLFDFIKVCFFDILCLIRNQQLDISKKQNQKEMK